MKSIFRIVALLSLLSACAFGTVNVSGTIKDPSGTVVPNSFVRFELTNTNNGQCSVSGASIGKRTADFTANATTGAVSGTLYRNDTEVSCAGSFNTRYNMTIFRKGVPDGPSKCVDVTADFDISAPQYCTTPPPVANPAQYVTTAASNSFTGNNAFSGNNTHSGVETFASINGVYYTSPEIDTTKNICSAIDAGWLWAVAKGWSGVTIDARAWHGVQDTDLAATQANPCFKDFPYVLGGQAGFEGKILTSDVTILVHSTFNPPNTVRFESSTGIAWQQGSPSFSSPASMIQAANDFPTGTPVVDYSQTGTTGTNPRGIWMSGIGVNCVTPNGTYLTGSIGIRNQNAQELSGGDHIHIQGCNVGLDIENSGFLIGAQNSGPWNDIVISAEGVPTTNTGFIGVRYGSLSSSPNPLGPMRAIRGLTVAAPLTNVNTTPCVAVDGFGFALEDVHLEKCPIGIELGKNQAGVMASIANVQCGGITGTAPMSSCVHISSAIAANAADVILREIDANNAAVTNTVQDDEQNGHTIVRTSMAHVMFYSANQTAGFGAGRMVLSPSPEAPSNISSTDGGVVNVTGGASQTLDNTAYAKAYVMVPTSSAGVTATLPPSVTALRPNWFVTIINGSPNFPVFINPNSVNLMGFTNNATIPPRGSATIYTNGTTSYYAAGGWNSGEQVVPPSPLTGQTTSTGDQTVTCRETGTQCSPGLYMVSFYVNVTTAGTAGTLAPYCKFTDRSGTVQTITPVNLNGGGSTASLTAIGNNYMATCHVYNNSGNLKWGVAVTGATGTPQFSVDPAVQRLSVQ